MAKLLHSAPASRRWEAYRSLPILVPSSNSEIVGRCLQLRVRQHPLVSWRPVLLLLHQTMFEIVLCPPEPTVHRFVPIAYPTCRPYSSPWLAWTQTGGKPPRTVSAVRRLHYAIALAVLLLRLCVAFSHELSHPSSRRLSLRFAKWDIVAGQKELVARLAACYGRIRSKPFSAHVRQSIRYRFPRLLR